MKQSGRASILGVPQLVADTGALKGVPLTLGTNTRKRATDVKLLLTLISPFAIGPETNDLAQETDPAPHHGSGHVGD